ncbi:MAG TPA: secretin N-terminal domain-containing protein [Thermoanaerobaculia bacterium]|nr:secretin N-terminal domain-containing protein [Thermoanaerobaculia bacterium]
MNKTLLPLLTLLLLLGGSPILADDAPAGSNLSVKTFQFKHKEASRAATAIKSLISAEGSISIQPSSNTLVVSDHIENLKNVAALLLKFDAPSRSFKLSIRLVAASRVDQGAAKIPDELKPISQKLSGLLRFNSFESVGEISAEGAEGDAVVCDLQGGFHADFLFGEYDVESDSIRVSDLQLSRLQPTGEQSGELVKLLKTSLNLKVGQMVIMSVSRDPQSQKALMVVFVARKNS